MTDRLTTLWQQRYRTAPPPELAETPAAQTDIFDSLLTHRSVRAYLPDTLPEGTIEAAVAAAQSAPSSSNLQAWSVVALRDPGRRARFSELCGNQAHIAQAPVFLVWLADLSRLERVASASGQGHEALDYTELTLLAAIDTALAAQNAVATLEAAGLGTVYIGGLRNHPEEVARELGLPARCIGVFGLCVGYPDPSRPASVKPRLPQPVVLHHEHYGVADEASLIALHDARDGDFQKEQGLPPRLWSETMAARIATRAALHGRDTILSSLRALGFPMK
ncbi:NADPH-dependent oxidoreductase [Asaia krungthepensis]|nr:NADPH-dependent oxidoreductase [Asaia krungthepensis]